MDYTWPPAGFALSEFATIGRQSGYSARWQKKAVPKLFCVDAMALSRPIR